MLRTAYFLLTSAPCLALVLFAPNALGATNTWVGASGFWQYGTNWSLNAAPSPSDNMDLITNAGVRTIVIDSITSHVFPTTMSISNLTLSVPPGTNGLNTLYLSNASFATPLKIINNLTVGVGGALYLSDSALTLPAPGLSTFYDDGKVTLSNSWIYATNGFPLIFIANSPGNTNGSLVLNGGGVLGFYMAVGQGAGASGSLTINDGLLSFPSFSTNLVIGAPGSAGGACAINGGQVQANVTTIGAGGPGTLTMHGGSFFSSLLTIGYSPGSTGVVAVLGGQLRVTNLSVGYFSGDGTLIVGSNGVVQADRLLVATNDLYGFFGHGTLIVQPGGTLSVGGDLLVGASTGSTGQVNVTGGTLSVTNGVVRVGSAGNGQMNISGGNTFITQLKLGGSTNGGEGVLQLTGGHLTILSSLSANLFVVGGGDLDGSGGTVIIGDDHDATMDVSSGTATNIGRLFVGYGAGFTGTFNQDGGVVSVRTNVVVGDCTIGAVGNVTLNGGAFYAQNDDHTATFDVRDGTVVLNPDATLIVDTLILTNVCGHFTFNNGTLRYNQLVLPANAPPLLLRISYNAHAPTVTLSWSSLYVGYFLEENPDLSPGNWTAVGQTPTDDGTTRSVTVTPPADKRFYRLSMPQETATLRKNL